MPRRWRSKAAREIAAAVEQADGTIELTGKGHLRITGPAGTAVVASAPDSGHQGGRALANTWATIERETGLVLTPVAAARSPGRQAPAPARLAAPARRRGEITRWQPGDTYGFITDADGSSWFVSRDSLPEGVSELPEGTQVQFSGSPRPRPGKGYPEARQVRAGA